MWLQQHQRGELQEVRSEEAQRGRLHWAPAATAGSLGFVQNEVQTIAGIWTVGLAWSYYNFKEDLLLIIKCLKIYHSIYCITFVICMNPNLPHFSQNKIQSLPLFQRKYQISGSLSNLSRIRQNIISSRTRWNKLFFWLVVQNWLIFPITYLY